MLLRVKFLAIRLVCRSYLTVRLSLILNLKSPLYLILDFALPLFPNSWFNAVLFFED